MATTTPAHQAAENVSNDVEMSDNAVGKLKDAPGEAEPSINAKKEAPPPFKDAASSSKNNNNNNNKGEIIITKLGPYDVLLGRGTGPSCYEGNKAFRAIVDSRKEEYVSVAAYKPKARIAQEVLDKVQSMGGRFVRHVEIQWEPNMEFTEDDEKWIEVDKKTALEKCKQALREHRPGGPEGPKKTKKKKKRKDGNIDRSIASADNMALWLPHYSIPLPGYTGEVNAFSSREIPMMQPPMQLGNGETPVDSRLLLYRPPLPFPPLQQGQQLMVTSPTLPHHASFGMAVPPGVAGVLQGQMQGLCPPYSSNGMLQGLSSVQAYPASPEAVPMPFHFGATQSHDMQMPGQQPIDRRDPPAPTDDRSAPTDASDADREDAALALSFLSLADRPRFTEEEEALEKATLTDEERAAALADTFGKLNEGVMHKKKKARRDLDRESINFLIKHMRHEANMIPDDQKPALLEALARSRADEFSDARLERFLRCDNMNATLAAQRFVTYWECRRSVFGEEKFTLPMTLGEALHDDIAAIEAGMFCLLPHKDLSGRQIIYLEPHRHTREGYTSESMLRAFWYTMEIASRSSTDVGGGFVLVVWDKHSALGDFDRRLWDRYVRHMTSAWPIKSVAIHSCCVPTMVIRFIKPILFALMNKESRSRIVFHGPEDEVLDSLSDYGILRSMLPTYMGGDVIMNQIEWIENRRAVEMEEI